MRRFWTFSTAWCLLSIAQSVLSYGAVPAGETFVPHVPAPAPVPGPAPSNAQCALLIPNLGKSSQFDHFNNINQGYTGSDTCVSYDAVNAAFYSAQQKWRLPAEPKGKVMTDQDINLLAEVLTEASKILAKQYGLPRDAVHNGLPLIDTRKTVIDRYCPAYLKYPKCDVRRYRQHNGMCNNLDNPHWGASLTGFRRQMPPNYADGVSEPRIAYNGEPLPTTRSVSATAHQDLGYHDHAVTVFLIAWGQAVDHDMTLAGVVKDPVTHQDLTCCNQPSDKEKHPSCWPIEIPQQDKFYSLFRQRCMEFVRTASSLRPQCKLGPRNQLNEITSTLDANFIYGSSKERADKLRTFKGGQLKSLPAFREHGLKDLLPLQLENPDENCIRPGNDMYCFMAGDIRANEQLVLTVIHVIMLREHNRIAWELSLINPHWDDEKLYQETRHIVIALVQHITYNELLPMVLGKDLMERYEIILQSEGYFTRYDPKTDPTVTDAFITSAYRFGHSLLPSAIERWSPNHKYVSSQRLSEMLLQPYNLYKGGQCDQYVAGLMNQVCQAMDDSVTQELTNHLFQGSQHKWGLDLAAINMQRGRDFGIPSYNAFREYCGYPRARNWNDLSAVFTNETIYRYSGIYKTPDDLDLWTAGISERPLPGSMVGPVFGCIIAENFKKLRYGDRFWYENTGWPSALTLDQLAEIRKMKLSRIVCDNTDHIETAQLYVMVLPDHEINPRVSCKSSVLPRMDLTRWRDTTYQPPPQPNNTPYSAPELPPVEFVPFQPPFQPSPPLYTHPASGVKFPEEIQLTPPPYHDSPSPGYGGYQPPPPNDYRPVPPVQKYPAPRPYRNRPYSHGGIKGLLKQLKGK